MSSVADTTCIIHLRPPHIDVYHQELYAHDVMRWEFKTDRTAKMTGYFYLDGQFICRSLVYQRDPSLSLPSQTVPAQPSSTGTAQHVHNATVKLRRPQLYHRDSVVMMSELLENSVYSTRVRLPTGVTFRVHPDSASPASWLLGRGYRVVGDQPTRLQAVIAKAHAVYDLAASESAKFDTRRPFNLHCKTSRIAGELCHDVWSFGAEGDNVAPPLCKAHEFGLAKEIPLFVEVSEIDGVLGLNCLDDQSGSRNCDCPLASTHKQQNYKELRFFVCLRRHGNSFMTLGAFPPSSVAPQPSRWIPIAPHATKWLITMSAIGCGPDPSDDKYFKTYELNPPILTLIDTGTTNCFFTTSVVEFIHNNIGGREGGPGYLLPGSGQEPPDVGVWFSIGGIWYSWELKGCYEKIPAMDVAAPDIAWYHSRVRDQGIDFPFSILGTAFLESYFVYFESGLDGPRIALEPQEGTKPAFKS